jgi:glycosyltransferase involved in cell wall biosynthesis
MMRSIDTVMAYCGCYTDLVHVSNAVRMSCRHYPAWLRDRARVVHNGILNWKPSQLTKAEARARLDLPDDEFVLVSAGRIDPQKNLAFLLPIVARLSGVTLVIAGDGSLQGDFARRVAELGLETRVRTLGAVPHSRVPDILKAGDVFVQPSLFEGQSNALLEGLHAGLPILSSDVPEQIEAMTGPDGQVAGAVLPLADPDAWVKAIEQLQHDPAALERASAIAHARANAFSFDRMISGFETSLASADGRLEPAGGKRPGHA